ncbi:hypothetical protein [Candidatus Enterococcus ikei]|uniref:Zinc ribbon domain-containing protein n=1 Tax=Candidatus Enterococcus ikei TaxID=2815326 RepID=A0ABS3GVZ7_9ENTE|nr:hypothetical protein [Enterococcus sp. DIV0869a]MBO0438951.1 hypothetical protein [Enterococcus sp. DIV0869a]
MKKCIQKIQLTLFGKIFIKCSDCKTTFGMDKQDLQLTKTFDGPYCPKCAKRLKNEVLVHD